MTDETRQQSGLSTLLGIWRRRKWLALLLFVVPMSFGISFITFLPKIYRSTATVLVDRQQIPESFVRSTVTSALETRLHAISQEILSRSRLEQLIERFGLYRGRRGAVALEEAIERMRADIKLELKTAEMRGLREAAGAFTISYQGSDPQTVSLVTNTLASFYSDENSKARERQASSTAEFLKAQLGETKKRLDEQEQRVSGFKRRHLGELPQQMETNLVTLDRLQMQLRLNADNQTRASERRQALSSQLAETESLPTPPHPMTPGPGGTLVSTEPREVTRLAEKKEELAKLRTQFSEKYPDVVQLAAEVAALEREVAEAKTREPKSKPDGSTAVPSASREPGAVTPYVLRLKEALSEAQTDLKILKAEEGRLRDGIASYQARIENVPRREQEFRELSRDYESTRELYNSLLKRYEEAQLAESMEQRQKGEQFRILDPAIPSPHPAAPNRVRLFIMMLVVSVGLAVGSVLLIEHLDTSFHTVDELRAFSNVPVLVSIPRIVTRTDRRRTWWRIRLGAGAVALLLALIVGVSYVTATGNERVVLFLARLGS
jgi:polysaccharide chain length determinant protein (PEP-CTERM system associated)